MPSAEWLDILVNQPQYNASTVEAISPTIAQSLEESRWHSDKDAIFWWKTIGPFLSKLLGCLQYSKEQRRYAEAFTRYIVAPYLGKAPDKTGQLSQWRSFMTDDFTPIEYSWTWNDDARSARPKLRFSIEPIGPEAGTSRDPWNTAATNSLLRGLSQFMQDLDLRWTEQLSGLLLPHEATPTIPQPVNGLSSLSSMFVAFEFGHLEPMVKTYFIAGAKATATKQSCKAVIYDALSRFAELNQWHDLDSLLASLKTQGSELGLSPFMVAVDCIAPTESRLKIYLRSQDTSFHAVSKVMTMFDDSKDTQRGLDELRELYIQLFSPEESSPSAFAPLRSLAHRPHQTSGMLYYVEIRPSSHHRTVKVYFPVKHYGISDSKTAKGLTTFLTTQDQSKSRMCADFVKTLEEASIHRSLASDNGMQTYISCAIKNGTLDITSYLNPEIYHPSRYSGTTS